MRRIITAFFCVLVLCFAAWHVSLAEIPDLRLSVTTLADLNQLKEDIAAERELHYALDDETKAAFRQAAKEIIEREYMSKYQSKVEWAWYDWEYEYTRDKDFYTFRTHLHFTRYGKRIRVNVKADIIWDGTSFKLERLYQNDSSIIGRYNEIPENHLIDLNNVVINKRTGENISALTLDELKELEEQVNREIMTNHNARNAGQVTSILQKTVNDLYDEESRPSWPREGSSVVCDWNCYEVTARIVWEENRKKKEEIPVFAELFPEDGTWMVRYLQIGNVTMTDTRDQVESGEGILFLNSRKYREATRLMLSGEYDAALGQFEALGDFDNSKDMAARCRGLLSETLYRRAVNDLEQGEYEEALALFESLGDWSDSREKAEECRDNISSIKYSRALRKLDGGVYEAALQEFEDLSGYKDSDEKAEEIRDVFREETYQKALSLMMDTQYDEAISLYESIAGYRDSDALLEECRNNKQELAYLDADALMKAGRYELAAEQFELLGDFMDSAAMAEKCRSALASIDREILFGENELILFRGGKLTLAPQVSRLSESAPLTTALKYSVVSRNSGPDVIRVDQNGAVTAVSTGEAVICCEAADNTLIRAEITARVVVSVSRVELSRKKMSLKIPLEGQETRSLGVTVYPAGAYVRTGTWSSGNESVATVDQEGNVKPLKAGQAVIAFTSDDTSRGKKEARCTVTVTQGVTSVVLEKTTGILQPGKTIQLTAAVQPQTAANKKLIWSSSDESVATVNRKGKVRAVREGEAVITAASPDGPSAQFMLTVISDP